MGTKNRTGLLALGILTSAWLASPALVSGQEAAAPKDAFTEATRPAKQPVRLYVENSNWLDVEVYALRGATRVRLGTVRSQEGRFFQIPARAMEAGHNVQLLADPVGSNQTHRSGTVMINPGDIVEWRLANSLNQSSLAVWST